MVRRGFKLKVSVRNFAFVSSMLWCLCPSAFGLDDSAVDNSAIKNSAIKNSAVKSSAAESSLSTSSVLEKAAADDDLANAPLATLDESELVISTQAVVKSENDSRQYRAITLANKLKVLLISDPSAEKSAAALNVNIGANQNPLERQGLAHFLEHMLFLGTEKYPEAGEYQAFIAQHSGTYNAYTAAENTNYFFEIDSAQLAPALDRFAQFFVAPLFNADYVERERNAVHSEYMAKLKDDGRREWDVYRDLMNPKHPSAKFTVGNHKTLADHPDKSVRQDLLDFYHRYYSSHRMDLVVLGRENLDQLQHLVAARFNQIPQHTTALDTKYPALFPADFLPASVDIKPEKELRELSFNFPIPNPDQHLDKKPYAYIAQLLGHEGKGSLLSLLKRLGWADALSAQVGLQSRKDAVFQLNLTLTPRGVKARDQIVSLVFHCIEQLRNRGVTSWRYEELKELADMQFRFGEKQSPMATVSSLAEAMNRYPLSDVVRGEYSYAEFDERLIEKSLEYLNNKNVLLVLLAPEVEAYRVSTHYATPYVVRAGIAEVLDLKNAVRQELYLPEKNVFMPRRLMVKSQSMLEAQTQSQIASQTAVPELIFSNANTQVWFRQDQFFSQPRAAINLRLHSPLISASAAGAAQAQLFAALITDQLREYTYPAHLAGLDYTFEANMRGFELKIFGYSSRQSLLLNKITEAISRAQFNEDRYGLVKADLLRSLQNEAKNLPYQVLAKQVPVLHYQPYWSNAELINALELNDFEQFNRFSGRQLLDAKLDALFYGNYFKSEALKLSVFIEHELLERQTGRALAPAQLLVLPEAPVKPWLLHQAVDHGDAVVELYIQAASLAIEETALMKLTQQLLRPIFFNELRTEKQLGYIVGTLPMPLRSLEATLLLVQSPKASAEVLQAEIDTLLDASSETIITGFAESQASLVAELREPARSQSEQAARYWDSILLGDKNFSRRFDLAVAIMNITPEALQAYYRARFLHKNRRLWLSTSAFNDEGKYQLIEKLTDYKAQMRPLELSR